MSGKNGDVVIIWQRFMDNGRTFRYVNPFKLYPPLKTNGFDFAGQAAARLGASGAMFHLVSPGWVFAAAGGGGPSRFWLATLKTIAFVQIIPWFAVAFISAAAAGLILVPMFKLNLAGGSSPMTTWFPLLFAGLASLMPGKTS